MHKSAIITIVSLLFLTTLLSEDVNEILFSDMKNGILQLNALSESKAVSKQQLESIIKFMENDKKLSRSYFHVGELSRECIKNEIMNNIKVIKEKKSAYPGICEWYLSLEDRKTVLSPAQIVFFNRIIGDSKERIEMGE